MRVSCYWSESTIGPVHACSVMLWRLTMRLGCAKGMPKFQEQTGRYSLHIHVTSELVRKYNEGSLERIATLEQNMATGEDAGKKPYRTALADLKALLSLTDLPVPLSEGDKIRLLMIYVITQDGIKSEERRQLMTMAGLRAWSHLNQHGHHDHELLNFHLCHLTNMISGVCIAPWAGYLCLSGASTRKGIQPEDQLTILALVNLGVTMMHGSKRRSSITKKAATTSEESTYDVSRYVPPLKRLVEDIFTPGYADCWVML